MNSCKSLPKILQTSNFNVPLNNKIPNSNNNIQNEHDKIIIDNIISTKDTNAPLISFSPSLFPDLFQSQNALLGNDTAIIQNIPKDDGALYLMMPQDKQEFKYQNILTNFKQDYQEFKEDKRRTSHNEVERRRRDKINTWIDKLSEIVPNCSYDQSKHGQSKGCILAKTVDYINELKRVNESLFTALKECGRMNIEIDRLKLANKELLFKLASLSNLQHQQHTMNNKTTLNDINLMLPPSAVATANNILLNDTLITNNDLSNSSSQIQGLSNKADITNNQLPSTSPNLISIKHDHESMITSRIGNNLCSSLQDTQHINNTCKLESSPIHNSLPHPPIIDYETLTQPHDLVGIEGHDNISPFGSLEEYFNVNVLDYDSQALNDTSTSIKRSYSDIGNLTESLIYSPSEKRFKSSNHLTSCIEHEIESSTTI